MTLRRGRWLLALIGPLVATAALAAEDAATEDVATEGVATENVADKNAPKENLCIICHGDAEVMEGEMKRFHVT